MHVCVCVCVCVQGIQYDYVLFFSFYVYIFVDLVKCGVLTSVRQIQCYRNDHYVLSFCV